mmetsp:Transcript_8145/g.15248  ORF Transcript_8145/g.15248 Transcript_8145/m.15248 type:complete len:312 (-) Transcript_8145:886-1821(-)
MHRWHGNRFVLVWRHRLQHQLRLQSLRTLKPPLPPASRASLVQRRQRDVRQWAPLDEGVEKKACSTPRSAVQRWLLQSALPQKVPQRRLLLQLPLELLQRNMRVAAKTGSSLNHQRPQNQTLRLELGWSVQQPRLPRMLLLHLRPPALAAPQHLRHRLQKGAMAAFAMAAAGALGLPLAQGKRRRKRSQQRQFSQQTHPLPHHDQRQQQHRRHLHHQCQVAVHNNPDGAHCCQMGRTRMTSLCQLQRQLSQHQQPHRRRQHLRHSPQPDNSSQGGVLCLWRTLMRRWKSLRHCLGSRNGSKNGNNRQLALP